jgi:RNA polymerase sigma-70 factor (ECF subfamily)
MEKSENFPVQAVTFTLARIIRKVRTAERRSHLKATEHDADERRLVEAAQRDPRRFAGLYEANFPRVYAYVARRVGSREEAEDLTAEVFHQALAGLGRFEWRGTPFVAWLLGIASHLLAHRWQRTAIRPEVLSDDLELAAVNEQAERQTLFAQLLDRLPPDQRRVLEGRFFEQRSIRELAQELGRSEGAVKQLQFRAIESLRNQVRDRHE